MCHDQTLQADPSVKGSFCANSDNSEIKHFKVKFKINFYESFLGSGSWK